MTRDLQQKGREHTHRIDLFNKVRPKNLSIQLNRKDIQKTTYKAEQV